MKRRYPGRRCPVSFRDRVALVGREFPHGERQPAQFRNVDLPLPMPPSTSMFWLQFLHLLPTWWETLRTGCAGLTDRSSYSSSIFCSPGGKPLEQDVQD